MSVAKSLKGGFALPRRARLLVSAVLLAYAAIVILGLSGARLAGRDLLTFAVFAIAVVASVEISLRLAWPRARTDRISRDFLGVWAWPVTLLLPSRHSASDATDHSAP